MIVLRDPGDVAKVAHPLIRNLAALRTTQILNGKPYDPAVHGYMVVVEPGDTVEQLEQAVGLPILHSLFDDLPYGNPDFAPCWGCTPKPQKIPATGSCTKKRQFSDFRWLVGRHPMAPMPSSA